MGPNNGMTVEGEEKEVGEGEGVPISDCRNNRGGVIHQG